MQRVDLTASNDLPALGLSFYGGEVFAWMIDLAGTTQPSSSLAEVFITPSSWAIQDSPVNHAFPRSISVKRQLIAQAWSTHRVIHGLFLSSSIPWSVGSSASHAVTPVRLHSLRANARNSQDVLGCLSSTPFIVSYHHAKYVSLAAMIPEVE